MATQAWVAIFMLLHLTLVIALCNCAPGVRPVYHAAPSLFLSFRPTPSTAVFRHTTKARLPASMLPPLVHTFKTPTYFFYRLA